MDDVRRRIPIRHVLRIAAARYIALPRLYVATRAYHRLPEKIEHNPLDEECAENKASENKGTRHPDNSTKCKELRLLGDLCYLGIVGRAHYSSELPMGVAAHQSHKHTTLKYPSSAQTGSLCIKPLPVDSRTISINSAYNTSAKTHGKTRPAYAGRVFLHMHHDT